MKTILLCLFSLSSLALSAQLTDLKSILDSGKKEFRERFAEANPNYSKAYGLFKEAVKLDPNNAEARYFLGYTLDKMNMLYGMDSMDRDMSFKVSEQFEACIKIQPHYTGELVLLDPYSKLTANWGSLAIHYLNLGKKDSARWAFMEGRKRGGFIDALLHVAREEIKSCSVNSILISDGDNATFPLYYLQIVEKLRQDVTLVDAHMLNTDWYPKYLKRGMGLKMSLTDSQIDTIPSYRLWSTKTITIVNPTNPKQALEWEVKPSYYDQYIVSENEVLLDIVKQNLFRKDIYFGSRPDSTLSLSLDDHFWLDGLVCKIQPLPFELEDYVASPKFYTYSLGTLTKKDIEISKDAFMSLNGMRLPYLMMCQLLNSLGKNQEAKSLFREMDKRLPIEKLPFFSDEMKQYYDAIAALIKA
ncbi:MAG: tetratricopeptide repeat protein [Flavisolibacter sp.]